MEKVEKEKMVADLKGRFSKASIAVISQYSKVTVEEVTVVRRDIRGINCDFKVLKNSLAKIAVKGTSLEGISEHIKGTVALTIGYDDPSVCAKAVKKHADGLEGKLEIKGAMVDGSIYSREQVMALAELPPRDQLVSMLLSRLQSPIAGLCCVTSGLLRNLTYVLSAVKEKKEA